MNIQGCPEPNVENTSVETQAAMIILLVKEHYTRPEIAKLLGMTEYQVYNTVQNFKGKDDFKGESTVSVGKGALSRRAISQART